MSLKPITLTELRKDIFNIFDHVIKAGVPQKVERNGFTLTIVPQSKISKLDNLVKHDSIIGDPDDLVNIKSWEWKWEK